MWAIILVRKTVQIPIFVPLCESVRRFRIMKDVREVQTSCKKNMSFTVATPRAMAAPTPIPLKTRPTIRVVQVFARPVPKDATMPINVETINTGRLP